MLLSHYIRKIHCFRSIRGHFPIDILVLCPYLYLLLCRCFRSEGLVDMCDRLHAKSYEAKRIWDILWVVSSKHEVGNVSQILNLFFRKSIYKYRFEKRLCEKTGHASLCKKSFSPFGFIDHSLDEVQGATFLRGFDDDGDDIITREEFD